MHTHKYVCANTHVQFDIRRKVVDIRKSSPDEVTWKKVRGQSVGKVRYACNDAENDPSQLCSIYNISP